MGYIENYTFVGIENGTKKQFGFTEQQLLDALDDAGDYEWDAEDIADILSDIYECVVRVEPAGYQIGDNNETEPNTLAQVVYSRDNDDTGYDRVITTTCGAVVAKSKHITTIY